MGIRTAAVAALMTLGLVGAAQAQMAVVDVRAIFELRQQISYWRQQISSMQRELTQLQATHAALTGARGMQNLLSVSLDARNYLPNNWEEMQRMLAGQSARFGALSRSMNTEIDANAVLTPAFVAGRSPGERAVIEDGRSHAAWLAATTRDAYGQASTRFGQLQQLIAAVGQVGDAKAVADLQARIASEQAMLANEQAKLELLAQLAQAEQAAQAQRMREQALAGHGQFAARFQPVLR